MGNVGINKVMITGNLTSDPERRTTPDGTPVCDMRVAIPTRTKAGDEACFINVVAWDKQADSCANYLHRGSWVLVEGRLKLNEWQSKQGEKRSKISIVAHKVLFLSVADRPANREENEQASNPEG